MMSCFYGNRIGMMFHTNHLVYNVNYTLYDSKKPLRTSLPTSNFAALPLGLLILNG